jgi:type II secretory pathway component PulM
MIDLIFGWFRSRSARERLLITIALGAIFLVIGPLFAYRAASTFRAEAAVELQAARTLERDVAALVGAVGAVPGVAGDGSLQGLATANAGALSLQTAGIETVGSGGFRVSFEPARSIDVYRWMEAMTKRGAFITQSAIVREGDGDLVRASFVVSSAPS